jgi:hypothetical protein
MGLLGINVLRTMGPLLPSYSSWEEMLDMLSEGREL